MSAILLFALRQRFAGYVRNAESVIGLVLRVLYVLILLIYAAVLGWLLDVFAASDTRSMSTDEVIRLVSAGFCGLWALLEFFPAYTQRSRLISGVFPVSFMERWRTNLLYDMVTATTLGTVVAFCLINALSKTYTHAHLTNSLLLFGNTVVFVQLIKAFVEATHRNRLLLLSAWVVLTSIVVALVSYQLPDDYLLMGGLGLCLLGQLAALFYADRSVVEAVNSPLFMGNLSLFRQLSPVYAAFLNNPKSRSAFLFGLALKALFLSFAGMSKFGQFPMNAFLETVYVAPLILFTYVANNIWGFFPALWVNSTLGKRSESYRTYFQLIALPIGLDLLVTLSVMLYLDKLDAELLIFYTLSSVALTINGLVFSLYKAFYVQSSLNFGQMKNNVNGWSMLTAALLLGLTILALKTVLTTLLLAVGLIAGSWYILNKILPNDTDNTHTLYNQLFTNND